MTVDDIIKIAKSHHNKNEIKKKNNKRKKIMKLIAFAKEKLDGRELTPEEKMEYLIDQ